MASPPGPTMMAGDRRDPPHLSEGAHRGDGRHAADQ
jgi:hypothetical protein